MFGQTQFILDVCWALSVSVVQLFLLQFYTRLYSDNRRLLYLCYTMMALVAGWFLYAIIAWSLHCRSPDHCELPTVKTCIAIGSIHIIYNITVMGMAVPAVYNMHFFSRRRLSFAGLLLLGTLYVLPMFSLFLIGTSLMFSSCTLCGIFRMECCLVEIFGNYETDPIASSWGRMLFSPLEIAVGIIACSIPTLEPFQKYWDDEDRGITLRKLGLRANSTGSSQSELALAPANWGKSGGKVSTSVTLGDCDATLNVIKVTKEYDIGRRH
jgi:hypothetical protein